MRSGRGSAGGRRRWAVPAVGGVLLEAAATWARSRRLGGDLVVRCRQGHLFTTIWVPGVSVKSLRLGWWRYQHCPVGRHWAIVTPVNQAELTDRQLQTAHEHHDLWIP
ncbi:MAG: hypothetical protein JO244_04265 [Solirubrobacterales bacterium]|nr:hypothetical protein [Solirubrobacterales bacterium]